MALCKIDRYELVCDRCGKSDTILIRSYMSIRSVLERRGWEIGDWHAYCPDCKDADKEGE